MHCYLSFSISEMWLVTALWRSMENTFCSRRKLFQSAPEPCTINRESMEKLREAKSCRRAQKTLDWTKVCIMLMVTVTQVCSGVIYRSKHIVQAGWGILHVLAILGLMQATLCSSSKWDCTACSIAGIAQWLEHWTRDWKVTGSNPCWNGGRIFFSRVDFLCWLLFRYPFHPRVTTVARKKSRSFCQKCRWQVTAKHAYTLRIEPCFGIGHNLSLMCQMTSEDIKHQLNNNIVPLLNNWYRLGSLKTMEAGQAFAAGRWFAWSDDDKLLTRAKGKSSSTLASFKPSLKCHLFKLSYWWIDKIDWLCVCVCVCVCVYYTLLPPVIFWGVRSWGGGGGTEPIAFTSVCPSVLF